MMNKNKFVSRKTLKTVYNTHTASLDIRYHSLGRLIRKGLIKNSEAAKESHQAADKGETNGP
jgi:hypothetical protein